MKKILIILLTLVLALSLFVAVACDEPDTPNNNGGGTTPDPYTVDMNIGANTGEFAPYELQRGENQKQLVIYWREAGHDYADNDLWIWADGKDGEIYQLHPCEYGAKVVVNVPSDVQRVGFIVRKNSNVHSGNAWGEGVVKVYDADRFVVLTQDVTQIYLTGKNAYQFISTDGGKTLKMIEEISKMSISSLKTIAYNVVPAAKIDSLDKITVTCNGEEVQVESLSSLNVKTESGIITLKNGIELDKTYQVTIEGYGSKNAIAIEVFDSKEFVDNYTYSGNDLGAVVDGDSTTFKVWAPTASKVVLNLYTAGNDGEVIANVNMELAGNGVWTHTATNAPHGTYYTYTVTTAAGAQEAVDPYAKSAGVNGMRGMVVDFAQADVTPTGFDAANYLNIIDAYTDAIIWEVHVRDFSNQIATSNYKGKYLAFAETGLTNSHGIPVGVDYVKSLGVTHLHMLPVYDYKTVDESKLDEPQFNWGYDPQNYNVPEGSYSTNPYDGAVRVKEFRQMVQSLHDQGLGVVMDVVYNHTYSLDSNLAKVVPNYYYRYNEDGTASGGSGCGNDTASERPMFRKYMVDSVVHWLTTYKLDGFRFDLMGLHDLETMRQIEQAVHKINPNAIIYGEAWSMNTAVDKDVLLATQPNINQIVATQGAAGAIAVFNDATRDGLRGSVFEAEEAGYLADPTVDRPGIMFGLQGGDKRGTGISWSVANGGVINYISAHDNHTLWDKLAVSTTASEQSRLAMNRMGAAIIMASSGTPFMQAGEEILRSKPNGDGTVNENSYNASDAVNNIRWEDLTANSNEMAMFNYYKGLIAMRKSSPVLTANSGVTVTAILPEQGRHMYAEFDGGSLGKVVVVINPTATAVSHTLPAGNWSLVANGTQAGATEIASASGTVSVEAQSVHVYFSK